MSFVLNAQMVSLANEIQSYHLEKKKEVSTFTKSPVVGGLSHEPSLYDIISYSYCYVGIMTGIFHAFCVDLNIHICGNAFESIQMFCTVCFACMLTCLSLFLSATSSIMCESNFFL